MRHIISPEVRTEVIARYLAGDRPKNIAIALGINDWNVSVIMRRAGLSRNQVDAQQLILSRRECIGNTRYTIDHGAFSTITPDSAYWAGFLMADGHVSGNKIKLGLAIKDKAHVERFRLFAGSNAPLRIGVAKQGVSMILGRKINSRGDARVTVASPQMSRDLAAFGVTERKTFSAKVSQLETNRDFWRGVIDGDGSLFLSGTKPYLALIGSEALMKQFLVFCQSIVDTRVKVISSKNIFKVCLSSGPAYALINVIYDGATVFLDRKMEVARHILSKFGATVGAVQATEAGAGRTIRVRHAEPTFDIQRAKVLYERGYGYKRLSREFGVSAHSIWLAFNKRHWHIQGRKRGLGGLAVVQ